MTILPSAVISTSCHWCQGLGERNSQWCWNRGFNTILGIKLLTLLLAKYSFFFFLLIIFMQRSWNCFHFFFKQGSENDPDGKQMNVMFFFFFHLEKTQRWCFQEGKNTYVFCSTCSMEQKLYQKICGRKLFIICLFHTAKHHIGIFWVFDNCLHL